MTDEQVRDAEIGVRAERDLRAESLYGPEAAYLVITTRAREADPGY